MFLIIKMPQFSYFFNRNVLLINNAILHSLIFIAVVYFPS